LRKMLAGSVLSTSSPIRRQSSSDQQAYSCRAAPVSRDSWCSIRATRRSRCFPRTTPGGSAQPLFALSPGHSIPVLGLGAGLRLSSATSPQSFQGGAVGRLPVFDARAPRVYRLQKIASAPSTLTTATPVRWRRARSRFGTGDGGERTPSALASLDVVEFTLGTELSTRLTHASSKPIVELHAYDSPQVAAM